MYLNRLFVNRFKKRTSVRLASTVVGKSGRIYVQSDVLQGHRENQKFSIFKAESGNESFVFKRVPRSFFNLSMRLANEFVDSRRLRLHIDSNEEEAILIYPYYKGTLLEFIPDRPDLPSAERKKILRGVAEAIHELHRKHWIHIDIKPDNVLLNWERVQDGSDRVTDVALGDCDITHKSEGGKPYTTPYAIGNAMWRSPEGQTGSGVTKASDIFSFGLVCVYALGGSELLVINNYQELLENSTTQEQEILTRHFCYFGPVPERFLDSIEDEDWRRAFRITAKVAEATVEEQPQMRFEQWGEDLGTEAKDAISRMVKIDPLERITIDQVLAHKCWEEED